MNIFCFARIFFLHSPFLLGSHVPLWVAPFRYDPTFLLCSSSCGWNHCLNGSQQWMLAAKAMSILSYRFRASPIGTYVHFEIPIDPGCCHPTTVQYGIYRYVLVAFCSERGVDGRGTNSKIALNTFSEFSDRKTKKKSRTNGWADISE